MDNIKKSIKNVESELKQLNTHLDKINYLIYQYVSEVWTKDKQLKVLTELKNWTDK